MKQTLYKALTLILLTGLLAGLTTACSPSGTGQSSASSSAQTSESVAEELDAAKTPDAVRTLLEKYKNEKHFEAVLQAAQKLIELDASDADAYTEAAAALLELSKSNYEEINRLLAQAYEKADPAAIVAWANENDPKLALTIPMRPSEINREGITTGNLSNAGKYGGIWRGGLLTWQGKWVYLTCPGEDFAIYKMRADGSEYQRVGEEYGDSLNAVGLWLYYINHRDGDKPYKIRTDGTEKTKISDDVCGFLSVSGEYLYFCGNDDGGLYKRKTDGSGEAVRLAEGPVIFPCVSGEYVYFSAKKEDGGLFRVSVDGGEPQKLLSGASQEFCVLDDWLYYFKADTPYGILRIHTDGTGEEAYCLFNYSMVSFNMTASVLGLSYNTSFQEDGLTAGRDFITLDAKTFAEKNYAAADTDPVCTGPDGWLYFYKYSENFAWYAMDAQGNTKKIG